MRLRQPECPVSSDFCHYLGKCHRVPSAEISKMFLGKDPRKEIQYHGRWHGHLALNYGDTNHQSRVFSHTHRKSRLRQLPWLSTPNMWRGWWGLGPLLATKAVFPSSRSIFFLIPRRSRTNTHDPQFHTFSFSLSHFQPDVPAMAVDAPHGHDGLVYPYTPEILARIVRAPREALAHPSAHPSAPPSIPQ